MYERHTYLLNRVTIIAPLVDNDGDAANYAADLRQRLAVHGFSWTEHQTTGVWQCDVRGLQREPGILFEDILPIFADPSLFEALVHALELHIKQTFTEKPDVIVGLDARGFLFGPTLALRLGAAFVPVRKRGKLPGPCETAEYMKEYGADFFQMQADAVKPGQKVLIVDDIIATGECGPSIPSALGQYADKTTRRLRICCGYPRREARRQDH